MARKLRIAALGSLVVSALGLAIVGGAFYAARQVRPFYRQALQIEPEALERGGRELESRATALYSDAKQVGRWQALFTAEQINGWLATQLAQNAGDQLPTNFRDPRIAIARDLLTLGFRTTSGGVDTIISVDAAISLTEEGDIAIRLLSVRAGALPLPVTQLADELADGCKKLKVPVRWTTQNGQPVALIELRTNEQMYVDDIQLDENQLYVAGHTGKERGPHVASSARRTSSGCAKCGINLNDYELRLTPHNVRSPLELAHRPALQNNADAN
ncbi:MAG TPA: hypothetical protein VH107_13010 [Lacipirellulaceae bacterium]|jgi:hypothetical protein|nr:hypothetical protein [Lacipirellulaceae bacterium]